MGGASFRSYGHEAFWFDQAERHYRMDMRTREVTTFDALTNTEKLRIALFEASFRVPGEAGHKLLGLLSTTNLAITASVLAIWVGSHATPLGWVVDITMVGVGLLAIGAEAADVAQELCLFANGIIDASDEMQCRMAASHLARAVAIIGVDVVLAILLKKAVFTMKSRFKAPEAAPVPALPAQQRATPSQIAERNDRPSPNGKKATETGGLVNQAHVDALVANGVKINPASVVATGTTPSGQIVFLETGNSKAGLQHIIEAHADDFAKIGVTESQIPGVVMKAVEEGKIIRYQGAGTGRPVYQTTINGQTQNIAITVGSNGFIVGANPAGRVP